MGTTPLGFKYADNSDPVDIPASLQQLAESVDEYLTPDSATVTPTAPYGGLLRFLRVGSIVVMVGGITRAPASGMPSDTGVYQNIGSVPAAFAPLVPVPAPPSFLYNTNIHYQISVQTDGTILWRHLAQTGSTMSVALTWLTAGS